MKNLENVKALNDMEMAMVAGGHVWLGRNFEKADGCFLEKADGRFLKKRSRTLLEASFPRL